MSDKACKKTTIGGQALIEGILMRGPRRTSIAVRKSNGEVVIKNDDVGTASHKAFFTLPFVRGIVNFWDAMKYGMGALTYSSSFFEGEDDPNYNPGRFERWLDEKMNNKKVEKAMMSLALLFGVATPVVLFILLPTLIAGLFGDGLNSVLRNIIEGAIKIVIFITFLLLTSKQKDVHRTYMYHGAEHKTIACYEKGLELTVENVRVQSRRHPRCGTSFLFVVIIVSILVMSVFTWSNPFMRVVLRLALLPLIVGISYEINRFAGRHDNFVTKLLRAPGLFLQGFTTFEPDDSMIEVAIEAMKQVIPENQSEDNW